MSSQFACVVAHNYDCVIDSGVLGFRSQSNLVVVNSELTKEVPQVRDNALCSAVGTFNYYV